MPTDFVKIEQKSNMATANYQADHAGSCRHRCHTEVRYENVLPGWCFSHNLPKMVSKELNKRDKKTSWELFRICRLNRTANSAQIGNYENKMVSFETIDFWSKI